MYHGRKADSKDPRQTGNVILFVGNPDHAYFAASDESSRLYRLDNDLPVVPDYVIEFAAEYYGVDNQTANELCNPAGIVNSAGAWDDAQFVSDLWQAFGDRLGIGFSTPDGAVVIDPAHMALSLTDVSEAFRD